MLFFFYGTLMDPDLLRALAGRKAEQLSITPGFVLNYQRLRARSGNFPVLVPRTGGRVPGLFVEGLDHELLLWVAHFEGPGYLPGRVAARDLARQRLRPWTFLPISQAQASPTPWDFVRWQRADKAKVRWLMQNWLLESTLGRPLALDVPWRVRRRLRTVVGQGNDQPRPNPHLEDRTSLLPRRPTARTTPLPTPRAA